MSKTSEPLGRRLAEYDEGLAPRRSISGWAVTSLIVGLGCLLVPLSVSLLPHSLLAIVLGLLASIRLSRPEPQPGRWMANLCLGLGVASLGWSLSADKVRIAQLEQRAGEFAAQYLTVLATAPIYDAFELKLPASQRQEAGVDLEAYYEAYQLPVVSMPFTVDDSDEEQPNFEKARKMAIDGFKRNPVTLYVQEYADAQWTYAGTELFERQRDSTRIRDHAEPAGSHHQDQGGVGAAGRSRLGFGQDAALANQSPGTKSLTGARREP